MVEREGIRMVYLPVMSKAAYDAVLLVAEYSSTWPRVMATARLVGWAG